MLGASFFASTWRDARASAAGACSAMTEPSMQEASTEYANGIDVAFTGDPHPLLDVGGPIGGRRIVLHWAIGRIPVRCVGDAIFTERAIGVRIERRRGPETPPCPPRRGPVTDTFP